MVMKISTEQLKINEILNSNSKMIRNFFINGIKDERIKVIKKRGEQFILLQFIVEKKKNFFWNKLYMESYLLLPDPIKESKLIDIGDIENISFEDIFPNKVVVVTIDRLDIPNLIYTVYNNYIERLEIQSNLYKFADTINEWDKQINDQIKGISETEIEISE